MARVLIIDDDPALLQTMGRLVSRTGHEIVLAEDGSDGVRQFKEGDYDLVITDLIMPEKEGIETIMELRALAPNVKILAVSGGMVLDKEGLLQDAEALGADASLPKPFSVEEFDEMVANLLLG